MLHISIAAEPLFNIGPLIVTNSLLTTWVTMALVIFLVVKTTKKLSVVPVSAEQNLWEMIIDFFEDLTVTVSGQEKARIFFPLVTTFFLFILSMNWIGLLPGVGTIGKEIPINHGDSKSGAQTSNQPFELVKPSYALEDSKKNIGFEEQETELIPFLRAGTADLNTTLALALIAMAAIQFYAVKYVGWKDYLTKFFNFSGPIEFFVGILELISEFAKIISFAFRLFGNIFAGEVLLVVIIFLIPIVVPVPFLGMEIFVGVIQAFVFSMLTLVFLSIATEKHVH